MSIGYIREKLWQAVDELVGAGSVQNRLGYAAEYLLRLRADEFPERQRGDFQAVMRTLTEHGSVHASAGKLTDDQGAALARKICSIYIDLRDGI